jgi:hypothetical protein
MIRSYALTFSAFTLRTWKFILSNTISIDPAELYVIDAWLGFVPNLAIAEIIIRSKKVFNRSSQRPKANVEAMPSKMASATKVTTKSEVKPTNLA